MALVNKRYAEALVNLAIEKAAVDAYQEELLAVSEIYENEEALRTFLLNPENTSKTKKSVLSGILEGKVPQDILHFLLVLVDKGRVASLPGIYREYVKMANEKKSILNITIFAAAPIDQPQIDSIRDKFRVLYNAHSVKTVLEIDPSLIGGVKVAIGDKLYDGTVKGRLERLHASLVGQ